MEISFCNKLYWHKTDSPTQLHHSIFQQPLSRWPIWDGKPPLPSARICVRKVKSRMLLGGLGQLGNIKKHCLEILEQLDLFKSKVDYCKKASKMWLYILQSILETFEKQELGHQKNKGCFGCVFSARSRKVGPKTRPWLQPGAPVTVAHYRFTGISWWGLLLGGGVGPKLWAIYILKSLCFLLLSQNLWWLQWLHLEFFHVIGMDAEWCGLCWETQRYRGHCAFLKWTFTDFGVRFSLRILQFCTFEQYLWHCAFWVFWIVGWSFGQALEKPDESLRESLLSKADSSFNGPALGAGKFQKKTTET